MAQPSSLNSMVNIACAVRRKCDQEVPSLFFSFSLIYPWLLPFAGFELASRYQKPFRYSFPISETVIEQVPYAYLKNHVLAVPTRESTSSVLLLAKLPIRCEPTTYERECSWFRYYSHLPTKLSTLTSLAFDYGHSHKPGGEVEAQGFGT